MSSIIEPKTRAGRTLAVASAATLLVLVTYTTALTTIAASGDAVGAGPGVRTWVLGGMGFGLAAALLSAGTFADRLGHGRVFAWASAVLAATSAAAALAQSPAVLVGARILQGVAGAGMIVTSLAAIGWAYPSGDARTRATGVWGAMVGGGIALGPLLAAALAALAGWRAAYWLDAAAALALVPGARTLAVGVPAGRRRFDLAGAAAFATGMACATAGLVSGRDGWTDATTLGLLAAAVAALVLFAAIEARRREPMLDLRLFRRPTFVAATLGALFTGLAVISLMSYLPTFLALGMHETLFASAGVLAIWSGTSTIVALAARRLPARIDARTRLLAGLALAAAGEALLSGLEIGAHWWRLAPGLFVAGVGFGIGNAALGRLTVASVPAGQGGVGVGINNTARYLGGSAGLALVVAIVAGTGGRAGSAGLVQRWNVAALVTAGLCVLGMALIAACTASAAAQAASAERSASSRSRCRNA